MDAPPIAADLHEMLYRIKQVFILACRYRMQKNRPNSGRPGAMIKDIELLAFYCTLVKSFYLSARPE
jgi:hypothetical protein